MASNSVSDKNIYRKQFLQSLVPALAFAGFMFLVKMTEWGMQISFSRYGLRPRDTSGLLRIFSFPFLHSDWGHLFSNILPLILFITLIFSLFPRLSWKILIFTFVLSGFWTWCFARPGLVIGASGWVYSLLGFLLWAGFGRFSRQTMVIAGGLAFLFGGMVVGLVPIQPHISWEGHLMGLLSGFLAAVYWRKELKNAHQSAIAPQPLAAEEEPSYEYWLYPYPHVIDQDRRVIHPDDLIWVNGKPQRKPEPQAVENEEQIDQPSLPSNTHTSADPFSILWQVNIS